MAVTAACGPVDCDGTTWRACGYPGCPDRLDMAAVLAGEASPRGWWRNRLVHYLCPDHAHGGHVPDWVLLRAVDDVSGLVPAKAAPVCSCGWNGVAAVNLGAAREGWQEHVSG